MEFARKPAFRPVDVEADDPVTFAGKPLGAGATDAAGGAGDEGDAFPGRCGGPGAGRRDLLGLLAMSGLR
jgi:hypothetical protein